MLQGRVVDRPTTVQAYLCCVFLAVTDHCAAVQAQCQHSYRLFGALVEAQLKAQLHDSVRTWLVEHSATRAHHQERLDLATTIVSWAIYGAAMEWSTHAQPQAAEAFADEALPLIVASIAALNA